MTETRDEFVTTLLFPNEYARNLNQVSGLSTQRITYLKRKFVSTTGYELVTYPIEECYGITYKDERPLVSIVFGVLLIALIAFIGYMVVSNWDELQPGTKIPLGALALAGAYGVRHVLGARRHRLEFSMRGGTRLTWTSRSGDYNHKEPAASKVVEFAKARGLLTA